MSAIIDRAKSRAYDERSSRPPWLDYDVPEGSQIISTGVGGRQEMFGGAKKDSANLLASHSSPSPVLREDERRHLIDGILNAYKD